MPPPSAVTARFNPRARMGRDGSLPRSGAAHHQFQPTRPHGARLTCFHFSITKVRFNPRARMGRDPCY